MAASSLDLLQEVGLPGSATTLAGSGYTIGDPAITVPTTTNHPTATGYTFAIDVVEIVNGEEQRVAGTYCEFVGKVASATSISEVSLAYGTPQNYAAGATTRVYIPVSSERENRIVEWGTAEHGQNGTHDATKVAMLAGAQTFTGAKTFTTAPTLPASSIPGSALASYRVLRQNDTTNTTETAAKILSGWGVITPGAASSGIEAVTFSSAFSGLPVVVICGGGDNASSTTYGAGVIASKRMYADAVAITATGFNAYVASTDGSSWAVGNTVFYQWIAIGV